MVLIQKNNLRANYYDMKSHFWILDDVEIREKRKEKILKSASKNLYLLKFFIYSTPLLLLAFFAELYNNFILFFPDFVPDILQSNFVKILIKCSIFIFECFNISFLISFDTVIVCTIIYLKMQFDILGVKLQEVIDIVKISKREELIKCINYHCFLIR